MDGSAEAMCYTTTAVVSAVWNSLTSTELRYRDKKLRFRDREVLKLAAVYLSFKCLCFLNYVTKFVNYIPKWFLTGAPRRKPMLRNAELLSFMAKPPKVLIKRKGCLLQEGTIRFISLKLWIYNNQ
jgi:hypothetical protein